MAPSTTSDSLQLMTSFLPRHFRGFAPFRIGSEDIALTSLRGLRQSGRGCSIGQLSLVVRTSGLLIVTLSASSRFAVKRFRGCPSPSLHSCRRSTWMQEILGTCSTGRNSLLQVHIENSSLESNLRRYYVKDALTNHHCTI